MGHTRTVSRMAWSSQPGQVPSSGSLPLPGPGPQGASHPPWLRSLPSVHWAPPQPGQQALTVRFHVAGRVSGGLHPPSRGKQGEKLVSSPAPQGERPGTLGPANYSLRALIT